MEQKFIDYIRYLDILEEHPDTDFSDPAFAYDYNEVQELYFDEKKNNSVFLAGESGLRKKDMLSCRGERAAEKGYVGAHLQRFADARCREG